ncbi:hypothetical protein BKE30_13390 [Alkanindiges hydrocarboniclasticus]|uniref:Uncharacterized protein n=2 Tax=Alkanindiges hydrocarboniclasticus TaxID=1907941 RepID=A0A1S8CR16_9GAMM|nr:hypothetical protein BKE30_13390 [Alkanindiges hydrocarboniclasticus]
MIMSYSPTPFEQTYLDLFMPNPEDQTYLENFFYRDEKSGKYKNTQIQLACEMYEYCQTKLAGKLPVFMLHVNVDTATQAIEVGYYDKTLPVYSQTHPPVLLEEGGKAIFNPVKAFTDLAQAEAYTLEENQRNASLSRFIYSYDALTQAVESEIRTDMELGWRDQAHGILTFWNTFTKQHQKNGDFERLAGLVGEITKPEEITQSQ